MSTRELSKMGIATVALNIDYEGHRVIDKFPVGDVEFAFYQHTADELNQEGIATPQLIFADPNLRKLRLEYIPNPVDQSAVAGDDVLAILGRLHRYPANFEWRYHHHSWAESALEKSLILLALPNKTAQLLRRFQCCSHVLFYNQCLVSGDSNAGNWGKRDNGDLVLFDWERFGTGSPAIDLAPLTKGMGSKETFIDLAERYCRISSHYKLNDLAREIAITKAWIVTEVITLLDERQKAAFPIYLNWYRENLPDWLDNTVKIL
ncbi:phosphotransferase [Buttiauxella sp. WJP83]|uniref:phosphotransferase family protein n=1 Tax=Buttiauxella sp. WJP83 TaxID=2986951 RepID=UPI0022DDE6A6|nr:phosphotransferase [Buttiauxella sp. WJP83]WBM68752.1 phosphotransferase [Buttiauxella sp. WJP83]